MSKYNCRAQLKFAFFIACTSIIVVLVFWYGNLLKPFTIHADFGESPVSAESEAWAKSGHAELEQLLYFWYNCSRTCPAKKTAFIGNRSHTVQFITNKRERPYVRIQEYFLRESTPAGKKYFYPSGGGSSFRVELLGHREAHICSVRDHFNGTYTGTCPKIYGCVNGTVFLDYVNFEAFRHHDGGQWPGRIHEHLITEHICPERVIPITPKNGTTDLRCLNKATREYVKGRWWKIKDGWNWGTDDGCILPFMSGEKLKHCYQGKRSIRVLGDSHVQNMATYLRQELRSAGSKLNSTPFTVVSAVYPPMTKKLLSIMLSNITTPLTASDIVLFNFGIWDVVTQRADKLIEEKFPPFLEFIKGVRTNPLTSSLRIIYINTSPRRSGQQDANYFMIPAVNEFIQSKLKEIGIEIIDGFNFKNVMINTTCDSGHFLCTSSNAPARGKTGMIFAQLVFRLLCD